MGPEAKGAPGPPRYATRGFQVAVSGGRGKGGNPVDALPMPDSPLNEAEHRVQPAFMKSRIFNSLLVGLSVVAAFAALRELPERDARPAAHLPVGYAASILPPAALPLRLAGAWTMKVGDKRFGGLSALMIDGGRLVAVSDRGAVMRFDPPTAARPMIRLSDLRQGPGDPGKKKWRDAESIVRDPRGRGWWVGYEQRHSLWLYDHGFQRAVAAVALPDLGWGDNRGAEALLTTGDALLAFGENGREAVRIGPGTPQLLRVHAPAQIADAARAPDGSFWVLLRSRGRDGISQSIAPLKRFRDGYRVGPQWPVPKAALDNFEGMAIESLAGGGWRFWLVTDDGHRFMARTLLVALDLDVPAATHDKGPARGAGPRKPSIETP